MISTVFESRQIWGLGILPHEPHALFADITEKGFNFLLMEMHQQSWILVRQYIQYAAKKHGMRRRAWDGGSILSVLLGLKSNQQHVIAGLQVKEILELLLQWGAAVNQQVEVSSLSSSTHMIAQDLSQLGLFMPCQIGTYPTSRKC